MLCVVVWGAGTRLKTTNALNTTLELQVVPEKFGFLKKNFLIFRLIEVVKDHGEGTKYGAIYE